MAAKGAKYRPIQFESIPYPLVGGVDTKYSGVMLPAPKLQVAENVESSFTGSLQRRAGRSSVTVLDQAGAVVSGLLALGKVQGRLLGYTQSKIYDLSEAENRWIDRGRATSWRVRKRAIVSADTSSNMVGSGDMAVLGSYRCYAYDIYTPGTG